MGWLDFFRRISPAKVRHRSQSEQIIYETINREIEIMNDCVSLVNDSCNMSTVLARYDLLIATLTKLSSHSAEQLRIAKVTPQRPFSCSLSEIVSQRDIIFNQAIQRAFDHTVKEAQSLKTEKGRQNKIMRLKTSILSLDGLSQANIDYLNNLIPN